MLRIVPSSTVDVASPLYRLTSSIFQMGDLLWCRAIALGHPRTCHMIVVATELLLQEEKNCRGISIYVDILYMYYVYDIYI